MSYGNLLDLAKINPEFDEIIKNGFEFPVVDPLVDVAALRAKQDQARKALPVKPPSPDVSYLEEDRQIPVRDGTTIAIRIHSPRDPPAGGSPLLVIYHGGGYCFGGLDNELVLCRNWVTHFGGVAVNVDYRLAPEHPFPTGFQDAYDALKWTVTNLEKLKVDTKKGFLLGGTSAGACFTAALSHLYRGEIPSLTGIFLSIPPLMEPRAVPEKYKPEYLSREQNKNAPLLNKGATELVERNYKPDYTNPICSPFNFPSHKDLPPTYFQICGMDPVRDEGLLYERVLREDYGILTKMDIYPGLPHAFWVFFPEASFSKKWLQDSNEGFRWLLEQGTK